MPYLPMPEAVPENAAEAEALRLALLDIALAAAAGTLDPSCGAHHRSGAWRPGRFRQDYLADDIAPSERGRTVAMAHALASALSAADPERIGAAGRRFGIPIDDGLSRRIAAYCARQRPDWMSYRR